MTNHHSRESKENQTGNQALLIIGLVLIPSGIATANAAILAIGIVFFIIGLAQRNERGKSETAASPTANVDKDALYDLFNLDTNTQLGKISGAQLIFLIDNLEEEFLEDQDYAINRLTLDYLRDQGADTAVLELLNHALGSNEEVTIVWKRQ